MELFLDFSSMNTFFLTIATNIKSSCNKNHAHDGSEMEVKPTSRCQLVYGIYRHEDRNLGRSPLTLCRLRVLIGIHELLCTEYVEVSSIAMQHSSNYRVARDHTL
jgi:hypothetical protein